MRSGARTSEAFMAHSMSRLSKLGLVLAGYAAALLVTFAVSYLLDWMNPSPDASGGMQAFGDLLRFVAIFGVLALGPSALALYFLRPFEKFWVALSIGSLALAATGVLSALMVGRTQHSPGANLVVNFLGLMKVLGAPLFGLGFVTFALFAPTRRSRWIFVTAAAIEFAVGGYGYFCLYVLGHWPS